ncbi:hypothetical protein DL96DRAFT_1710815 [Flagelloscypha sp. PMI_526]|nr:hypothetical protein DL96DRAFT_1710815 [Flagelloscypha sp. PMI_526]
MHGSAPNVLISQFLFHIIARHPARGCGRPLGTIQDEDLERLRYYTKRIQTFDHPWLMPWEVDPALLDSIFRSHRRRSSPSCNPLVNLTFSDTLLHKAFLRWVLQSNSERRLGCTSKPITLLQSTPNT